MWRWARAPLSPLGLQGSRSRAPRRRSAPSTRSSKGFGRAFRSSSSRGSRRRFSCRKRCSTSRPPRFATPLPPWRSGGVVGWWGARNLGPMLTVAIETREGGELVTSGPYARIRHPIYTGIFLQVAGLGLALASPLVALALPVAVFCGAYRARLEEDLL